MIYKTVLFDFHNVLCFDHLFDALEKDYPKAREFIETKIFGGSSDIPDRWMRGEMDSAQVNRHICQYTGMDYEVLSDLLVEGIKNMHIDERMLELARQFRCDGIKTAIVTDNMDVFSEITVEHHKLGEVFPVIVNSFDQRCMKQDCRGRIFDVAMNKLGESDYGKTLLIDDSVRVKPIFENKGGAVFTYEAYETFEPWMAEILKNDI